MDYQTLRKTKYFLFFAVIVYLIFSGTNWYFRDLLAFTEEVNQNGKVSIPETEQQKAKAVN